MNLVQERILPELTDEFAKNLGNFSSLEALKINIREGIGQEKKEKENQRIRMIIIEKIADRATIEIPEILVERELDKMLDELKSSIAQMGMKWEDYLLHIKKNPEELRKEWHEEAQKRVRIALSLREIANREKIDPTEEEIKERADQYLAQFKTAKQAEQSIDPEELQEYARGILRNEKVFEFFEGV